MKFFIMDRDVLTRYNLPLKADETFSVSYKPIMSQEEILITFEARDGKWFLKSNGSVYVNNNDYEVDGVIVQEYENYNVRPFFREEALTLFFLPINNEVTYKLNYNDLTTITIGSGQQCNIIFNCNLVSQIQAEIKFQNGLWYIFSDKDTFLNNKKIKQSILRVGDIIFVAGLKAIWMGSYIKINNPKNLVSIKGLSNYIELQNDETKIQDVSEIEKNISLYKEDDYFYHMPRIKEILEEKNITIDSPPNSSLKEELPFLFRIGSSLTLIASSGVMLFNIFSGISEGKRSIVSFIPQMATCLAMLISSLILPRILSAYQKKRSLKAENLRKTKYREYLSKKDNEINMLFNHQKQIMNDNNLSIENCITAINTKNKNFWSREISDDDFLNIRLGNGNKKPLVNINAPEEKFSLEIDELLNDVYQLKDKYKVLSNVPITISLVNNNVSAFVFQNNLNFDYINGVILQIMALHSANDLKFVVFTNSIQQDKWSYLKFLSYCWSADKQQRFFATSPEEYKDVSNFLLNELKTRNGSVEEKDNVNDEKTDEVFQKNENYKNFSPYYLIICDDYKLVKDNPLINEVLKNKFNYGCSIVFFETSIRNLPAKCDTFIEIGDSDGAVLQKNISSDTQVIFKPEIINNLDIKTISLKIANVPIITKAGLSVLPQSLSFLEMYGVSKIEQLNISNRWRQNNPVKSLSAPIGVHANKDLFYLDLHEKFHGPHGLIAGSTGSGKSEFIITYILSMALNYHPYEIQFVLIDYKGGGLAGAFENKETGVKIPHLAGTITNLDISEMNRTLVSIESELKRRQKQFNEVRDALGEGTIDIYKYQKLFREGLVKEPMSHLFIISDEFAELKKSQPEFMQQLISTARIGRSLGVHLILATQKPSGVVNDQIWSNSKFKVCLKVQDRSDSMEMLKRPEAASIKEAGRFYLQVGYDDLFDMGQSGWAGAKYIPSDKIIHKVDDSIDFVDNVGSIVKTVKDITKNDSNVPECGEQLTNIVKYIYNLGIKENITTRKLWLDALPKDIFVADLKNKYGYKATPYKINPIIGEYDNPQEQQQGLLTLDLTNNGNTLIYGQPGSGKENLLSMILLSTAMEHTPEEVNFYILDFGSGVLKLFNNMPHVGEIIGLEDGNLLLDFFDMIFDEFENRKQLFADFSGSYVEYCENNEKKLPLIVVLLNNYDIFTENYAKIAEKVTSIYRDGSKYGIVFIITAIASNAIRGRMSQNFNHTICLKLPNDYDYRSIVNSPKGLVPANIFGRGLVSMDKKAYEFQTCQFVEKKSLNNIVRQYIAKMNEAYKVRAKRIPTVPNVVKLNTLYSDISALNKVPIGYSMNEKKVYCYNFIAKHFLPIVSDMIDDDKMSFIYSLIKLLLMHKNTSVCVIDLVSAFERNIDNVYVFNKDFDSVIDKISENVQKTQTGNFNVFYIVLGIGQLASNLNPDAKAKLDKLFDGLDTIKNNYFIVVDTYSSYKNLQVETWYQANVDKSCGIWLGDGAGNQYAINISNLSLEERKINFRYMMFAVTSGKHTIVKHVVEEEDTNEQ